MEDSQEPPPKLPAQLKGPTLDSLTNAEISQDCQDIVLEIVLEVVESVRTGPTAPPGHRPPARVPRVVLVVSAPHRTSRWP